MRKMYLIWHMRESLIFAYVAQSHGERELVECGAHPLSPHVAPCDCATWGKYEGNPHMPYEVHFSHICMYVYVYMYIYIHTHTYKYIYIYIYIYKHPQL